MTLGVDDRLAAQLAGADLDAAHAALSRSAGPEVSRLAYLILEQRAAAEAVSAAAIAATIRRAESSGWPPTGSELRSQLVAETMAAAVRRYGRTHEVDPLAEPRPTGLPAEPLARSVVVAVLLAGLPHRAAARAVGISEGRARRILRTAIAAAGSERHLRDAMAAPIGPLSSAVMTDEVVETGRLAAEQPRGRWPSAPAMVAAAALGFVLLVVGSAPPAVPDSAVPASSGQEARGVRAAPLAVPEAGVLPTLTSCGIGPPDASIAYAGWITVDELGAAPPDTAAGQPFYALVPAGEVAWNPAGLSRRIMPPVRGRLACLSTVTGAAPTVVGLPAGWEPPETSRFEPPALDDCGIRPADAPLAHRGWLLAEHIGDRPASRPVYALVTADRVSWNGDRHGRLACVMDVEGGAPRVIPIADAWSPPVSVDGCPPSPLQRFAGNLELGGPYAFILLPPVSTSWLAHDPSVRIMARLSPGPAAQSRVTAAIRPLGPGPAQAVRVVYTAAAADREASVTHYVWLEGFVFTEPGCWVVSLAIDGGEVGWAVVPAV